MSAHETPERGTLFAVVVATRTDTRFVSLHRSEAGAQRAAERYNFAYPRGARAQVSGVDVYE